MSEGSVVYVVGEDGDSRSRSVEALRAAGFSTVVYDSLAAMKTGMLLDGPSCVCLHHNDGSAMDAADLLNDHGGKAPLLVLLDGADVDTAVQWMRRGAADVLAPPYDPASFAARVRQVLERDGTAHRHRLRRRQILERMNTLTRREREVMKLVVGGYSNKRIAETMGVSIKTVEVHRSRVMRKMNAESLAKLVEQNLFVSHGNGDDPDAGNA